jgi:OmpR family response regulator RpaB
MVILDVMLPDMDGFEVCRTIRNKSEIPIIMLTARGDVQDRVEGLELGADDYLAKPFEPRELVARIQNILRRTDVTKSDDQVLLFENFEIDPALQRVIINHREVKLTSNEYQLLKLLVDHTGKPMSRDEITSKLRGANVEIFSRAVDISVSRLRQKLRPTNYIKTVWGAGYQFIAPES